jgi:hypothetical protein
LRLNSRITLAAVALLVGAAALGGAELLLRALGRTPWAEVRFHPDMPLMHEPDPELGWRNKEGSYVFGNPPIHMSFGADHTRTTASAPGQPRPTVMVLGDSFVQGWAVSDEETFAWRLQERFPRVRFLNFGCSGYGATQALLALKRYLAEAPSAPVGVLLGFSDFYDGRSVAAAAWLRTLAQLAYRGHVNLPYATVDGAGALELHAPIRYPAWPLQRRSALVTAAEEQWAKATAFRRTQQAGAVTQALLLEIDRVTRAHGSTLAVALLSQMLPNGNAPYAAALQNADVPVIDCANPSVWSPAMQVPVYGHPNGAVNAFWAACIADSLPRILPALVGGE